ncbi:methionyl-tRNA formyltransferase [Clostridium sp. MSJ-8]|uniref:methionyl-tRNA formyltransferase n=1 Tax=Clostridium sp. MSJ-8 TaxID=2841510 RepID=UPI001C0F03A0|nr:methionyl-tRNA formyltransferase [Clostridium sp. MSJ-8]MBU5488620.1 methionyl-tRNA formyltransferase [Clostridium sp. MSJ-8]
MNIVFMGTPDFAVPSLEALIKHHNVKAVFTQPDRPKGRGKKLAFSDVKEIAVKYDIPVYQPEKLKEEHEMIDMLKNMDIDFIIVVAFGQLLTKEVLDIPKYGCINLHGSLLPMYRGAAPIQWSVINGEKESGNTTMLMNEGLDTGDMLLTQKVNITEEMTSGELYDILKTEGSKLLLETIDKMSKGEITPIKQEGETCYAKMLDKKLAVIDWNNSAENIHNLIRGLNPWPIAFTTYEGQKMKIFKSKVLDDKKYKEVGKIIKVSKDGIEVSTGEGTLLVEKIQFPNGKPLEVKQYINGHSIEEGTILI